MKLYDFFVMVVSIFLTVLVWLVVIWLLGCAGEWKMISFKEFYNFSTWTSLGRIVFFSIMSILTIRMLAVDIKKYTKIDKSGEEEKKEKE